MHVHHAARAVDVYYSRDHWLRWRGTVVRYDNGPLLSGRLILHPVVFEVAIFHDKRPLGGRCLLSAHVDLITLRKRQIRLLGLDWSVRGQRPNAEIRIELLGRL